MRRRLIAAAWIVGATVPLLMATVFVMGCCVLPFHGVMHKLMPVCEMVKHAMRGDDAQPSPPAREKQEPVKRVAVALPDPVRSPDVRRRAESPSLQDAASYRSAISLGAIRCDQDVGWHVLVVTFLI